MTRAAADPTTLDEDDFAAEVALAIEIAERAGRLQLDRYERVEQIDFKSAKDIVTEVDHLSEALILDGIRSTFPTDALLGEETGEHDGTGGSAATSGEGRVWVVDPLDGTINYANGIPFFCVSIALVESGRPAVGVIHDPTRAETLVATASGPATVRSGRHAAPLAMAASDKETLSDFVISMALSGRSVASRARAVRKAVRVSRSMGSAALALAYVGNGRFDAFVQQGGLSLWDIAAAGLIAERGGGRVTNLDGGPWFDLAHPPRSIGILAAPPAHHTRLLELIRGAPAPSRADRTGGTRARS